LKASPLQYLIPVEKWKGKHLLIVIHGFKESLSAVFTITHRCRRILRVQFIRRTKKATTQAACARNTGGYHSEYGNSWFNKRENDDAYYMFRPYNNCYYSSSDPVLDEEDEL